MTDDLVPYSQSRHPAPHRDRVGLAAAFYGMFAAPIVWAGNLMVTYGLVGHACYPGFEPLGEVVDGMEFVWPVVVACYFVTMLICASGFVVSHRIWRITGSESTREEDRWHHLLASGEGRTRYFALIGMGSSLLFFAAVLFGAFVPFILPLCTR